jgi:uncharacterized protein
MGIGVVYADRLARRGYDLILVVRSETKLKEVATWIQSATGCTVETMRADLTPSADIQGVGKRISFDASITVLVNNTGLGSASKLVESDPNNLEQMIQLKVTTLMRLALAAASSFPGRANGLIINIGSILALVPELLNIVYSGTKAYVQNFSIGLTNELADKGVTVQLVVPSVATTAIWDKIDPPIHNLAADGVITTEDIVYTSLASLGRGDSQPFRRTHFYTLEGLRRRTIPVTSPRASKISLLMYEIASSLRTLRYKLIWPFSKPPSISS